MNKILRVPPDMKARALSVAGKDVTIEVVVDDRMSPGTWALVTPAGEVDAKSVAAWKELLDRNAAATKERTPMQPTVTPRMKHPDDYRAALVVRQLPPKTSGIKVEQLFDVSALEPRAVGYYETPGGVRITIVVDPSMRPDEWRLEQAATGRVINRGADMRRLG